MSWQEYEALKARLIKLGLSQKDYKKAIRKIVEDLKL